MVYFEAFIWVILVSTSLVLYRIIKGPSTYDRMLGVNVIGTKTIVILVLIGYVFERPYFFDIALLYAILNFIATVVIAKYLERGRICE
ncbi:MAG: monovalent cation/H+ antiporter complex subunit F [Candidatus Methanoperedens sp.]|jgi:multicomponent Na+:H+ antiporter subunit F|nr:monovalent cation/H+ antiporter complex subunit F [Candidatus Methanoperedens sp.]PKL54540.1 MAG: cation:proton antiporter [Candidatus Methanoperedenaceae archaeon HGW-Methanoperedenaceae-1]